MTSAVYQATVEELETLLSPRVVSRSLQEGLKTVGKSPQTVNYDDLEKILKAQVYRQLQVALPVTEAKVRIQHILERIKSLELEEAKKTSSNRVLSHQGETLAALKEQLKPFNLYFEWSEVQKLRALIQLLETEQEAGREAPKLLADARDQLDIVSQKLEDQLVHQAKALAELEAILEVVQSLGGAKVRRLDNLVSQIRSAQASRQLATAEVERSRKLAVDLRKLMESSVVMEAAPVATDQDGLLDVESESNELLSIDTGGLTPDISAKLLELDVEGERQDLEQLAQDFSMLLLYKPELDARLQEARARSEAKTSIAHDLLALRESFQAEQKGLRQSLQAELESMRSKLDTFPEGLDIRDLQQSIQISLGVLEVSLPALHDLQHVRSLFLAASSKAQDWSERQRLAQAELADKLLQQEAALEGFAMTAERYRAQAEVAAEYEVFLEAVMVVAQAQEQGQFGDAALSAARKAEAQLLTAVAGHSAAALERDRALLAGLLSELQSLPIIELFEAEASELRRGLEAYEAKLTAGETSAEAIQALRSDLAALKQLTKASYQERLDALIATAEAKGLEVLSKDFKNLRSDLGTHYPDLETLERTFQEASEVQRDEYIADLYVLETEANKYKGESETLNALRALIREARLQIEQGQICSLEEGWALIEALRQDEARRDAGFIPRLDAALSAFEQVSKLNSDEVASAGRILRHLDAQRSSFERVSAGVRADLEASLREAETLVAQLKEQYEATRAIAGQIVNASVLDDLFGAFDSAPALELRSAPAEPSAPPKLEQRSDSKALNTWLDDYKRERGVRSVAVFVKQDFVGGLLDLPLERFQTILQELDQFYRRLGEEIASGREQLAILEMVNQSVITAWPRKDIRVVVITDQPAVLSLIIHKLRRDLPQLSSWLSESSVT